MRFYHLLSFLGVASAAPSKADSLSIFDNPTIPWNVSDGLPVPILSHVRRAGSRMALNVSTCAVTVTNDPYWYQSYTKQATLYIISPIDSPGTKNGASIFEMFLRVGDPRVGGGVVLATNQFVMDFPYKPLDTKILFDDISLIRDCPGSSTWRLCSRGLLYDECVLFNGIITIEQPIYSLINVYVQVLLL